MKYDRKMAALREELELRRKTEIHEVEEVHVYIISFIQQTILDVHVHLDYIRCACTLPLVIILLA